MTRKDIPSAMFLILAVPILVTGCGNEAAAPDDPVIAPSDELSLDALKAAVDRIPAGDPSDEEIADILLLREEEKVARDTYIVLGEQYGLDIFFNIAASEQKHMDAVKILVDRYGLDDPVGENGIGEFTDEELQDLYDELIASGAQSLVDALLVGLAIEEIDILDLWAAMDRAELRDILMVYGNLCDGSENHLRAFTRVYNSTTGEIYEPRWMSQEAYDAIIAEEPDQGDNGNRGGGRS